MASLIPLLKKELSMLAQLGRLRMTIFSAVTYSTAFSMALHYEFGSKLDSIPFQTGTFLLGWAFILFCQLSAHFLGEYYDFKSDVLNRNASPFTGGSRVLVNGGYSPQRCLFLGWFSCISSFLILQWQLPNTVHLVGYVMIFLACQYSGAPLRFSHHALGELNAALVMNIFLPYFAAVLANPSFYGSFDLRLAMLIIPSALLKFALFIVLNMADRRADWLGGKITLPVRFSTLTSHIQGTSRRRHFRSFVHFPRRFRLRLHSCHLLIGPKQHRRYFINRSSHVVFRLSCRSALQIPSSQPTLLHHWTSTTMSSTLASSSTCRILRLPWQRAFGFRLSSGSSLIHWVPGSMPASVPLFIHAP